MIEATTIYEKIIHYDESKDVLYKLVVSEFSEVEYLHIRKYYRGFEGDWLPSSEGVSFPLDFSNVKELFSGLVELLSLAEAKDVLETHFKEKLDEIYLHE